jgi:hypothetical protein
MLEALRRHRRHVAGEGLPPGGEGEPPCEPGGEMARTEPRPPQDTPRGTDSDPALPGADASTAVLVDVDESPASPAPAPECPAGSDVPPPLVPDPPGIAPADDPHAPAATNEANGPGVVTNEANGPGTSASSDAEPGEDRARFVTNEANSPAEAATRPAAMVAVLALLVWLGLTFVRGPLSVIRPPLSALRCSVSWMTRGLAVHDRGQRMRDKGRGDPLLVMEEPWIIVKHPG